jgi:hypothetical protein
VPSGSGWRVEKNGRTVSTHRKQQRTIKKTPKKGSSGDQLIVHGADGTICDSSTIR